MTRFRLHSMGVFIAAICSLLVVLPGTDGRADEEPVAAGPQVEEDTASPSELSAESSPEEDEREGAAPLPSEGVVLSDPGPRQGYYFALGGFGGVAGFHHYKEGWLPVFGGGGGAIHTGQALNDLVALGLDIAVIGGGNADRNLLMGRIGLELRIHPVGNWFLRPAVGFGFTDFYRKSKAVKKVEGTIAASYMLSVGYDFVLSKKRFGSGGYTLSPVVWISGANGINLNSVSGGIGIEIARWGGLDRNQLNLSVDDAY